MVAVSPTFTPFKIFTGTTTRNGTLTPTTTPGCIFSIDDGATWLANGTDATLTGVSTDLIFAQREDIPLDTFRLTSRNLTALDVSTLLDLTGLNCLGNSLTQLNVSALTNLTALNCSLNNLTTLDVANLTNLSGLRCFNNSLTALNVANLTALTVLLCNNNSLSILDVTNLSQLTLLNCQSNSITVLNTTNLTLLEQLNCFSNSITAIDTSNMTLLRIINCFNNSVSAFDFTNSTNIEQLGLASNNLDQSALDNIVNAIWDNRASLPTTSKVLNISGQTPGQQASGTVGEAAATSAADTPQAKLTDLAANYNFVVTQ